MKDKQSNSRYLVKRSRPEAVRREEILDVAVAIFMERGYLGASVDELVRRVGGSKTTIYRYFGNKADLFAEIVTRSLAQMMNPLDIIEPANTDIVDTLSRVGHAYLDVLLRPESLALYRMVTSESVRFPELAQIFYERGPGSAIARISHYLSELNTNKQLCIADSDVAARQFLSMVRSDIHMKAVLGIAQPGQTERAEVIDWAVTFLLKEYGLAI